MNYLLDTHIALWAIAGSNKLPLRILDILDDNNNSIYISIASVWEIAIKNYIKPEQMPMNEKDFIRFCEKLSYAKLSIKLSHIYELRNLKRKNTIKPHNDPFDRLLLSQSIVEDMKFITHDSLIAEYETNNIVLI